MRIYYCKKWYYKIDILVREPSTYSVFVIFGWEEYFEKWTKIHYLFIYYYYLMEHCGNWSCT